MSSRGLSQCDGAVESSLYSGLVCRSGARPSDRDSGERFGDKKAVPGSQPPRAVRMDVTGTNGSVDELSELDSSGLGDHGRATRAIGGDGTVVAGEVSALHVAKARRAVAGAGAADGNEAKPFDSTGDEFAVKAAADEDGQLVVTEVPCARQQAPVPEGIDAGWRNVISGSRSRLADVAIAESDTEAADGHTCKARDDCERDALPQAVGGGHVLSLPLRGGDGI